MDILTAILVDDESSSLENLRQKLEEFSHSLKVVATAQKPEEAIMLIRHHRPHVVFLDIEMPRMSGFKVLEEIGKSDFEVIFVTAYNHYAIDAIRISAFDYLVKPVAPRELRQTMERLFRETHGKSKERLELLRQNLFDPKTQDHRIAIGSNDGIELLQIRDIIRLESNSNYSHIILQGGRTVVATKLLKDFEIMLRGYGFYRIHNSHLINLSYVTKYLRGDGGQAMMQNGDLVEVSRRKKDEFIALISSAGQ
jgi:two-component system, LytTR family, response regulator